MTSTQEILTELARRMDPAARPSPAGGKHLEHVEPTRCADGFSMSVQASAFHYCEPRDSVGPWHSVEVGFPTARVEAFMPYIDGGPDESPTNTVYGYVPVGIVAQAILDHGGFARSPKRRPE